jgi:hypothetical protein
MNNKVIAVVVGAVVALFAVSLLVRFGLLSQAGVPAGWLYFGLPVGGIGVLLVLVRVGLLTVRHKSGGTKHGLQQHRGVQLPPLASTPPAASASHRLQQLDTMRASGAISDTEYTAQRQHIISNL